MRERRLPNTSRMVTLSEPKHWWKDLAEGQKHRWGKALTTIMWGLPKFLSIERWEGDGGKKTEGESKELKNFTIAGMHKKNQG